MLIMHDLLKNKCVFFGTISLFEDLMCTTLSIDLNERKDNSVKSDFQWQILKCRILIFSTSNIMASPVLNSTSQIYVVMHKNFYDTDCFQHMLASNNLKILKECQVTSYIFEACLKYTLLARLAPKWNNVDDLLVEGRDFLVIQGLLNAVKYNITVNGSQIVISVCAVKVRLNNVTNEGFLDNNYNMKEYGLYHEKFWIHVLPSMKRGRIVSVWKTLPKNTCFKDYIELRRHWKNTYGYRLPEDDKEITYLGIHFFGPTVFTYPIHCVRTSLSILPVHHNYHETILRFVSDLQTIFPTICTVPFHITNEFGHLVTKLLKVNDLLDTDHPNWIKESPSSRTIRDSNIFIEDSQKLQNDDLFSTEESQTFYSQNNCDTQNVSLCTPSQVANEDVRNEKIPIIPSFMRRSSNYHNFPKLQSSPSISQNSSLSDISASNRFMENLMKPIKPTFIKPKKVNLFQVLKNKQYDINIQYNKQNITAVHTNNESNLFKHGNEENSFKQPKEVSPNNGENSVTKMRPIFQNKLQKSVNYLVPKLKCTAIGKEVIFPEETRKNSNICNIGRAFKTIMPVFQNKVQHSVNHSVLTSKKCRKRKEESLSEDKVKKRRAKQLNCYDIKQMALDGTLAKANMPSLIEYLKMNNISYKTKDKKGDLINKVLNNLNPSVINN